MKLTFVLLILTLQVSATAYSQQISLNFTKAPLRDVLQSIRKQSGYNFIASSATLSKANSVTLNLKSNSIEEILQAVFSNQPFVYKLDRNIIMISLKDAEKKSDAEDIQQQLKDLRGIVLDQDGKPLEGATVIIKETGKIAITNRSGEFLFAIGPENGTLLVRMIGHETKSLNFQNSLVPKIILKEVDADLKMVQIIAYGEVNKKFSTSTVGTITASEIEKQPVSNPLLALQGRVPGLFIQQTTGVSAGSVNITIQGKNSMQRGNNPFYVIDGIPYAPEIAVNSLLGAATPNGNGSAFNFINPSDIESVSILKDADATAIYGSRAANGAILITTKKGKSGKTKVDFNMRNGWGKIARKLDLLNTRQYLEMRKEAYNNAGVAVPNSETNPISSNYDLTVWDQNRYTDWQNILVGGTAQFTDAQLSLSGGTASTQFLVSYGYNKQTTVYPNSLADIKGNIHLNLNHNSLNNKFKYSLSANYLQDKNQLNTTDLMEAAISLAPNAPALYKADGSLNWEVYPKNPLRYSFDNPLRITKLKYIGNTSNIIANNSISYELLNGLLLKGSLGYNTIQTDETSITPITSYKPDFFGPTREASYLTKSISSWIAEPQLTYNKITKFGVVDLLLGGTFQQSRSDVNGQSGSGFTDDSQLYNLLAAPVKTITAIEKLNYKYNAIFSRLNYRLFEKYIVNFNIRRDGTSRFGDRSKFHTFYAIGGAWLFAEENLVKKIFPFLSTGKFRVNYGTTGSDQISDYSYLSLLDTYNVGIPYLGGIGLYSTGLNNPYLQWEETRKLNLGLQLGVLNDRIELDINYFHNRSSNQLLINFLPDQVGFGSILQNFPATVQNTGLEILIDADPVKTKNFTWHSSFNITVPRNKLVSFPGLAESPSANDYVIGKPINILKVYNYAGVNPATGLYEVYNYKGEKTSKPDGATDRTVILDGNPKWYAGFSSSFIRKSFSFDFLITTTQQSLKNVKYGFTNPIRFIGNQPAGVYSRWKKTGDIVPIQKTAANGSVSESYTAAVSSNGSYTGGFYTRLKNASISYTLPKVVVNKVHIDNARLYVQGQNLLTITNFIGTDPETGANTSLPPLRMITVGIQVGL